MIEDDDVKDFLKLCSRISPQTDPTLESPTGVQIKAAAAELATLTPVTIDNLALWVSNNEKKAFVLGYVLGMSKERLGNTMKKLFDTGSIRLQAARDPAGLITTLDSEFELVRLLNKQLDAAATFGDVLVARAGGQARAKSAADSGRLLEDAIEAVVDDLGLPHQVRTRFIGKNGADGPADLIIESTAKSKIIVAAKVFDSTGSKQSASVDEIKLMAEIRLPQQYLYVVTDGMGWASRKADLKRLLELRDSDHINGIYTMSTLTQFRDDVKAAAIRLGYTPNES